MDTVTQRYGAVLYLSPAEKYTISASINKAYNSSETRYVTIGETVYISCTADGKHTATGVITGAEGTNYTVETTSGELLMEETVAIYRSADPGQRKPPGPGHRLPYRGNPRHRQRQHPARACERRRAGGAGTAAL